jgi:hypothetical protein
VSTITGMWSRCASMKTVTVCMLTVQQQSVCCSPFSSLEQGQAVTAQNKQSLHVSHKCSLRCGSI